MIKSPQEYAHSLKVLQGLREGRSQLIEYARSRGIEEPERTMHVLAHDSFTSEIAAEVEEYQRQNGLADAAE